MYIPRIYNSLVTLSGNGLHEDINTIAEWCETWSMSLNAVSKCKVIYFGKNNPHKEYHIQGDEGNIILEATDVEKDLGVMVAQVETEVNKASWVLGRIRNSFRFFSLIYLGKVGVN